MGLWGATGLKGGVSETWSPGNAWPPDRAEEETKVGDETMRDLRGPELAKEEEEAAGVDGDELVLR